ncbi:unnamed protein product [Urochloa humidicola]
MLNSLVSSLTHNGSGCYSAGAGDDAAIIGSSAAAIFSDCYSTHLSSPSRGRLLRLRRPAAHYCGRMLGGEPVVEELGGDGSGRGGPRQLRRRSRRSLVAAAPAVEDLNGGGARGGARWRRLRPWRISTVAALAEELGSDGSDRGGTRRRRQRSRRSSAAAAPVVEYLNGGGGARGGARARRRYAGAGHARTRSMGLMGSYPLGLDPFIILLSRFGWIGDGWVGWFARSVHRPTRKDQKTGQTSTVVAMLTTRNSDLDLLPRAAQQNVVAITST